ncbi:hypothetical protein AB0E62_12925 [Streptomyces sp. NPDC038707]|uniref:hypothetical protein n=1 Tax=Streptomyces sp. NPDC038707 TaxID=3154329 RepID=UPI0033D308B2
MKTRPGSPGEASGPPAPADGLPPPAERGATVIPDRAVRRTSPTRKPVSWATRSATSCWYGAW